MPKQNRYQIQAAADNAATIYIYGDIGEDFWAEESNDAKSFIAKLNQINASEITVRINSYGGIVADALAIYNALKRHSARIITTNDGVAMSAGSLIFMAGDDRQAAANSLLMIHAPSSITWGNASEHRDAAEMLDKYADAMTQAYIASGKSDSDIESLLKDGEDHYYTADEAISEGFATEVTETVQIAASAKLLSRFSPPAAWVAANQLKQEEPAMPQKNAPATANTPAVADPLKTEAPATATATTVAADNEVFAKQNEARISSIRAAFKPFKDREGVQDILDSCIDDHQVSADAASQKLLAHLGTSSAPLSGNNAIIVGESDREKFVRGAVSALLVRSGAEKPQAGNEFRGMTLLDIARASLEKAGVNPRGMDKRDLVGAAFTHTTSDFPILLETAMHKTLMNAYATAPDTWSRFCRRGEVSDFRAHGRYRVGSFGNLDSLTEANEFKNKNLSDGEKESITAGTKGNVITITRQAIINDDLDAFNGLAMMLGRAARRTIEQDVYALLAANPTMSDGVALFHATHGNLASSGAAVTSATIEAARVAMAQQKDVGGNDFLDIRPGIFVGGMASGAQARLVNNSQYDPDSNNKLMRPNIVAGLFSDVVDSPRITGTDYYLFADPNDAPVIEVGFLDGIDEPFLEASEMFNVDGGQFKVRLDYGVAAIDWRGAYKNPGQ